MANVTVTTTLPNITVDQTNTTVNVATTTSNVIISEVALVANSTIRQAISVSNVSGFGNLTYDNTETSNGVIQYVGVSTEDIRGQFSSEKQGTGYGNVVYVEANGVVQYTGVSNTDIKDTAFNDIRMYTFDDSYTLGQPTSGGWINYDQANGILQYRPLHYNVVHFDEGTYGNLNNEIALNVTFLGNNFDTNFATKTTDDLTEGSANLYYTTDRANTAIDNYTGSFANATINTTNTITTTANVAGANFIGNVVGDITGDIVGNVTGTLSGNVLYPSDSNVFIDVTRGDIGGRDFTVRDIYASGGNQRGVMTQQVVSNILGSFPPSIGGDNSPVDGLYLAGANGGGLEPVTIVGDVIRVGTSVDANVRVDSTANTISMQADSGISATTDATANIDLTSGNINLRTSGVITSNANIEMTDTDYLFVGDINGAVQQEVFNNTGLTIARGKAVYLTGGNTGDTPNVNIADNANVQQMPVIGVVKNQIPDATTGEIVTSGQLNIGSHGFTTGADLFVNGSGDLQEAVPTGEGQLIQKIGKVVNSTHIIVQGAFRTNATPNLDDGNIFLGNASNQAVTAVFTDEANTAIGAYTGDMLNVDDIVANTVTTSNAVTSQSFVYVEQQSNTSTGGIRAFEGGTSFTNFNTNQPALNVENGFLAIQASDETSNVFSVPRYAQGKLPDAPTITTSIVEEYGVTGGTFDSNTYAMPGGVEAPTGVTVSTVNKRRGTDIPVFGVNNASEGATPHSTGLIQFGVDDTNVSVRAAQSFGNYLGNPSFPMFTNAHVANGTITFRTIQTDILTSIPSIAPYNEAVNFANSTVAYMNHKFNIGREDDGTSYSFPKTAGNNRDYLRLDANNELEFANSFAGLLNDQGTVIGSVTFDMNNGNIHKIETAGDITDLVVSNKVTGTQLTIIVKQGSTTGALTGSTNWLWAGGSKTLSTNTGDVDVIKAVWDGTNYHAELTKGYVA